MRMVAEVLVAIITLGVSAYLFYQVREKIQINRELRKKFLYFEREMQSEILVLIRESKDSKQEAKLSVVAKKKYLAEWNSIWREYKELEFVLPKTQETVERVIVKQKLFFKNYFEEK